MYIENPIVHCIYSGIVVHTTTSAHQIAVSNADGAEDGQLQIRHRGIYIAYH